MRIVMNDYGLKLFNIDRFGLKPVQCQAKVLNFRQKEKLILDTILESDRSEIFISISRTEQQLPFSYDSRIRPSPVLSESVESSRNGLFITSNN